MNVKREYKKFIEKYPYMERDIVSYECGDGESLKFKLIDGKTAWYYPLYEDEKKINYATHTKQ